MEMFVELCLVELLLGKEELGENAPAHEKQSQEKAVFKYMLWLMDQQKDGVPHKNTLCT